MNERVKRLREQSVNTRPYISSERAELMTAFYKSDIPMQVSTPVTRGLAFKYLMEHKAFSIQEGELIVGERGPAPKATPTYPELCCHTLDDFEIMSKRDRTRFDVDDHVRKVYAETIIPFWKGKTMREKVFAAMNDKWMAAFDAGIFTEFMEQRAPGHAIHDNKIYTKGLLDFQDDIRQELRNLSFMNDPEAYDKQQQLLGFSHAIDGLIVLAGRYSDKAAELAAREKEPARKQELLKISATCKHVPAYAPRTFHEALQMYWFIHLGVISELNVWDSYNPGRLDQHLYPFYKKELEAGTLTEESAKELLECFWVKFNNQPAPPKVGITEAQSGTYTDFALINIGGVNPSDGSDAVNDVSFLMLDVVEEMKLVQPSACIQISAKNPDRFLRRACKVIKCGFGQPSVFNTDVIIREMLHDGKTMFDARSGGPSGCVETSAFGKESCTLTGYINWPKILELALNGGVDPLTGKQIGVKTPDATTFNSIDDVIDAYKAQLNYFVELKVEGNNVIERIYANYLPAMMLSILTDDCIKKARNYHNGGPRYNTTYIQGVGIGTLTDALAAIQYNVFDKKTLSMAQLLSSMRANFKDSPALQQQLKQSPRYGNDDDYADRLATEVFNIYFDTVNGRPNTKGGKYRVNLLPTTVHVYFGQMTGALPNGRNAGEPLSDGISPTHGADVHGPTAVIKSAAKIDHARTGGTLLNMKFTPQLLEGEGIEKLLHLIRSYFRLDGHHIQFNVVTAQTLRDAQKNPDQYRNLIVRVAGYSDYFNDLGPDLQNEIIARTEQQSL
ncbi:MAG: trans-4-hydroxy-L-proline dehydratase [Anaerohalosphaeraceae bacterium]